MATSRYTTFDANWGRDRISADAGGARDWLTFHASSDALFIDLVPSTKRAEVRSGANVIQFALSVVIEWVQGGYGNDRISGTEGPNMLNGSIGDDRIYGRGGNDTLSGDVSVFAEQGQDVIYGGPGNDTIIGEGGGDDMYGGPGNDTFTDDRHDADYDEIYAGPGDDTINMRDGDDSDIICTGPGNDTVVADDFDTVDPLSCPD